MTPYSEKSGKITFESGHLELKFEFTGYVFTDDTNPNMFTMAGIYKGGLLPPVPGVGNERSFFAQINI
ncbi:hypothetical protein [Bacillus sp. 22475]|uniref:hypothetical protein n=1 Tax=Bacillus sp. 22475 TaxID=3453925 RepID=UPI003F8530DE